jgi:hypothetical protein
MKMKSWHVEIVRYSSGRKQVQTIEITKSQPNFMLCNDHPHEFCKHIGGEIVLRNQKITSVDFYPSLQKIVIRLRKEDNEN